MVDLDLPVLGEKPWGVKANKAFTDLNAAKLESSDVPEELQANLVLQAVAGSDGVRFLAADGSELWISTGENGLPTQWAATVLRHTVGHHPPVTAFEDMPTVAPGFRMDFVVFDETGIVDVVCAEGETA